MKRSVEGEGVDEGQCGGEGVDEEQCGGVKGGVDEELKDQYRVRVTVHKDIILLPCQSIQ